MSVHFWGERPAGTWKLQVENTGSLLNRGKSTLVLVIFVFLRLWRLQPKKKNMNPVFFAVSIRLFQHFCIIVNFVAGKLLKWQLILYGVAEEPVRLKQPAHPKPRKPIHIEHAKSEDDVSESDFKGTSQLVVIVHFR